MVHLFVPRLSKVSETNTDAEIKTTKHSVYYGSGRATEWLKGVQGPAQTPRSTWNRLVQRPTSSELPCDVLTVCATSCVFIFLWSVHFCIHVFSDDVRRTNSYFEVRIPFPVTLYFCFENFKSQHGVVNKIKSQQVYASAFEMGVLLLFPSNYKLLDRRARVDDCSPRDMVGVKYCIEPSAWESTI